MVISYRSTLYHIEGRDCGQYAVWLVYVYIYLDYLKVKILHF